MLLAGFDYAAVTLILTLICIALIVQIVQSISFRYCRFLFRSCIMFDILKDP